MSQSHRVTGAPHCAVRDSGETMAGRAVERIKTADGSTTLRRDDGVTYRSTAGAAVESRSVFVGPCDRGQSTLRVLELGFGAATNFVTCVAALQGRTLEYFAVEQDPIGWELCDGVGLGGDLAREALQGLQTEVRVELNAPGVRLVVCRSPWRDADFGEAVEADAVFHDPFAVSVNPDAWTSACFEWEASMMAPDALMATYGAATRIRKSMVAAGLEVAVGPGFGRKREVTYASLGAASLGRWKVVTHKYAG